MSQEDFDAAAAAVKAFTSRPSDTDLLELYALYKQATVGDNETAQPWGIQFEARAKWDAWTKQKGVSQEDAKSQYVAYVEKLKPDYK